MSHKTRIANCPHRPENSRSHDTSIHPFAPVSTMTQSSSPSTRTRDARAAARAARAAAREASLLSSSSTTTSDEPDAEDDDGELSIAHVHQNNPFGFPPGAPPPAAA